MLRFKDCKGDLRGFKAFLEVKNLPRLLIPHYRGNRLHILFKICGIFIEHYCTLQELFESGTSCKELRSSVLKDLSIYLKLVSFCHFILAVPEQLTSDNGPQYASVDFRSFCVAHSIKHTTSSPYYPQSKGEAERSIQTIKKLWTKNKDRWLALFVYNSTIRPSLQISK